MSFEARDPDFAERVRDSFARQAFMRLLGAEIAHIAPGEIDIALPFRDELTQQHGFFHGGAIGTLADNAGGYASLTLLKPSDSVLTVEYKLNIVAPGEGERLVARGRVVRPGRRVIVCRADVFGLKAGREHHCATALGTFMVLADQPDDASYRSTRGANEKGDA